MGLNLPIISDWWHNRGRFKISNCSLSEVNDESIQITVNFVNSQQSIDSLARSLSREFGREIRLPVSAQFYPEYDPDFRSHYTIQPYGQEAALKSPVSITVYCKDNESSFATIVAKGSLDFGARKFLEWYAVNYFEK